MCLMKAMATLLGALVLKDQLPFEDVRFWASLFELIFVGCLLGVFVSASMSCSNLALSVAFYQSFLISCTIIAGNALYGELGTLGTDETFIFSASVLSVIVGLCVLTCMRPVSHMMNGKEEAEEEKSDLIKKVEETS